MTYSYKCDTCNVEKDVEASIADGPPKEVKCDFCESVMHRLWGESSIHIPDYMKAGASGDAHTDMVYRMKHASRPTGRKKTYW